MSQQERCPTVTVTAIWSRRIGDKVETLVEHDGVWKLVITEHFDGPFSHIAEARGLDNWAHDSTPSSVAEQPSREQAVEGLVIDIETARLINGAFLPTNPNKLRSACPEVIQAAKKFKEALSTYESAIRRMEETK